MLQIRRIILPASHMPMLPVTICGQLIMNVRACDIGAGSASIVRTSCVPANSRPALMSGAIYARRLMPRYPAASVKAALPIATTGTMGRIGSCPSMYAPMGSSTPMSAAYGVCSCHIASTMTIFSRLPMRNIFKGPGTMGMISRMLCSRNATASSSARFIHFLKLICNATHKVNAAVPPLYSEILCVYII